MHYWLLLVPIIGALIGWLLHRLVLWYLFHPTTPISLAGITIVGRYPAAQATIAQQIGEKVASNFISFAEIGQKLSHPSILQQLTPFIDEHVENFLRKKLPEKMPMIAMFVGDKTINIMKEALSAELQLLFPLLAEKLGQSLEQEINVEQLVADKIKSIPPVALEAILKHQFPQVFLQMQWLGALTGSLIGLLLALMNVLFL